MSCKVYLPDLVQRLNMNHKAEWQRMKDGQKSLLWNRIQAAAALVAGEVEIIISTRRQELAEGSSCQHV